MVSAAAAGVRPLAAQSRLPLPRTAEIYEFLAFSSLFEEISKARYGNKHGAERFRLSYIVFICEIKTARLRFLDMLAPA